MRSCNAKMNFVDVTALADSEAALENHNEISDALLFKEKTQQLSYATLEHNLFLLDGSKSFMPEEPEDVAFWSLWTSTETGNFEDVPAVEINFTLPHSSAGLTLYFAEYYPETIKIAWYRTDGTLIDGKLYHPDALEYVCRNNIENYGKIRIEFLESEFPDTYARLQYVMFGYELNWNENVIVAASITEENDITSATISKNTATIEIIDEANEFDIENTNGRWKAVQSAQEVILTAMIDGKEYPAGTFYISDFSFKKNIATFNAVDAVGLLDIKTFYDGQMYKNKKAGEILEEIFASAEFEKYEISEDIYNIELSGYLGIQSCREAIQMVCFACGAVVNDSRSDILRVYWPDRYVKHSVTTDRKIIGESDVSMEEYVSGVTIECGRYATSGQEQEIYNDTLPAGTTRLTFTGPYVADTITVEGGTCVTVTVNYVDVEMEAEGVCVVKGVPYEEVKFTYRKTVSELPAGTVENIKEYGTCTLYNAAKLPEVAERLIEYYSLRKKLSMKFFAVEERVGDWLHVLSLNNCVSYTLLESQRIDLAGGFISTASCRGYNIVVTELHFTGSELYAGGGGLI